MNIEKIKNFSKEELQKRDYKKVITNGNSKNK